MSKIIISIKNVTKTYVNGDQVVNAVDDISIDVFEKEMLAFAGSSGSGKTTLLNLIGGIDDPAHGEIFIDGVNLASVNEKKNAEFRLNNIGFVFQSYNLIPVLTAQENVEFVLELQGVSQKNVLWYMRLLLL